MAMLTIYRLIKKQTDFDISNTESNAVYNDHPYTKCQPQSSVANIRTQATQQHASRVLATGHTLPIRSQANDLISKSANDHKGASEGQVVDQCNQPNDQGKIDLAGDHHLQGTESVEATKAIQFCSTAQNVGTVNIGTACSSQQLIPSMTTTLNTPLVSLLSSIVPHISLPSLLHPIASQGVVSSSVSKVMPPKPATVSGS